MYKLVETPEQLNLPAGTKYAVRHTNNVCTYNYDGPADWRLKHWFHRLAVEQPRKMHVRFHGPENGYYYQYWAIFDPDTGVLLTNYWLGDTIS